MVLKVPKLTILPWNIEFLINIEINIDFFFIYLLFIELFMIVCVCFYML